MTRTLYIIGNGFDLHLGIKSSYSDFRDYIIRQWPDGVNLCNQLENFFPSLDEDGEYLLWSDFERALGNMDTESVLDYCKMGNDIDDYEDIFQYAYNIEDSPGMYFAPVLNTLYNCFHEWVNSLAIYGGNMAIPYFDRNALFFSFNYTETLENIYKVPVGNVCHIHGKRQSTEKYIYGHNYSWNYTVGETFTDDNALDKIGVYYRSLCKNSPSLIHNNSWFFSKLKTSSISKVVIYGCSLGDIDMPYFHEISKCIPNTAEWSISVYKTPEDVNAAKKLIKTLGLDKNLCHTFDFK